MAAADESGDLASDEDQEGNQAVRGLDAREEQRQIDGGQSDVGPERQRGDRPRYRDDQMGSDPPVGPRPLGSEGIAVDGSFDGGPVKGRQYLQRRVCPLRGGGFDRFLAGNEQRLCRHRPLPRPWLRPRSVGSCSIS